MVGRAVLGMDGFAVSGPVAPATHQHRSDVPAGCVEYLDRVRLDAGRSDSILRQSYALPWFAVFVVLVPASVPASLRPAS